MRCWIPRTVSDRRCLLAGALLVAVALAGCATTNSTPAPTAEPATARLATTGAVPQTRPQVSVPPLVPATVPPPAAASGPATRIPQAAPTTTTEQPTTTTTTTTTTTGRPPAGAAQTTAGTSYPTASGAPVVGAGRVIGTISTEREVTLTFDDGPGPFTGRVLDLLNAQHLHATFCQIGEQVGNYPDVERRIAASGDTFCNHSWDHDEHLSTKPVPVINSEIDRTQAAIGQATGRTPAFYRAPGGNWGTTPAFRTLLNGKHLLPLGWAVDSQDWRKPGVPAIVANVMKEVTPGAVILLHDAGGNRTETLTALPVLIRDLRAAGYTISAMPPPQAVTATQPTPPTTTRR